LKLVLPRYLTLASLRSSLRDIPIVVRNDSGLHLRPELRNLEPITIDANALRGGSPAALSTLAALLAWCRHSSESAIHVERSRTKQLQRLGFDDDLTVGPMLRRMGHTTTTDELALRVVHAPSVGARDSNHRPLTQALATAIAESILASQGPDGTSDACRHAVAEFAVEGLANIAEHAYQGEDTKSLGAWACASVVPPRILEQEVLRSFGSSPNGLVQQWARHHAQNGAKSFLQVAIADAGIGVVSSLGPRFIASRRQTVGLTRSRSEYIELHNEILRWALSPYGSRKDSADYASQAVFNAWRGLYRVKYRTRMVDGLLFVRTGFGGVGTVTKDTHDEFFHARAPNEQGHLALPGTTLALVIPLFKDDATSSRSTGTISNVTPRAIQMVQLAVASHDRGAEPFGESETDQPYREAVDRALSDAFRDSASAQGLQTRSLADQYVWILHPAIRLGSDIGQDVSEGSVRDVLQEDVAAALLLSAIGRRSCPGIIPLHFFLDVTHNAVQQAAAMYSQPRSSGDDGSGDLPPSLVGFVDAWSGDITWFIYIKGAPGEMDLASDGKVVLEDPNVGWLSVLLATYPGVCETEGHDGDGYVVSLALPNRVSSELRAEALANLLPGLSALPDTVSGHWFWRSDDLQRELVQTATGRSVQQYVNVNALCATYPLVETALAGLLHDAVESLGHRSVSIVAAGRTSAYALACRLVDRILRHVDDFDHTWHATVVHPDDIPTILESTPLMVFSDLVYSGSHVRNTIKSLPAGTDPIRVVVCIDAAPIGMSKHDQPWSALCRWPFPSPPNAQATATAKRLHVNLLTNELFEKQKGGNEQGYTSLLWSDDGSESAAVGEHLDSRLFNYGVHSIDGRVHVVSAQVQRVLADANLNKRLRQCIVKSVQAVPGDRDVVMFCRSDATLWRELPRLAREVSADLKAKDSSWAGAVFAAPVFGTRVGTRQMVRHHLATTVARAVAVTDERQPSLLEVDSKGPGSGFVAIFLDNAATSGRTLREFAVALADLATPPMASALLLLPIVNRLSPSEEQLLTRIPEISRGQAGQPMQLMFASVIQLRIKYYESIESTELFTAMRRLTDAVSDTADAQIDEWTAIVDAARKGWSRRINPLQDLCDLEDVRREVPSAVVYVRHLLSLSQQGLDVMDECLSTIRRLIAAREYSLCTMLSLEPGLLKEPIISRVLGRDLWELALEALTRANDPQLRRAALLVLGLRPGGLAEHAARVGWDCAQTAELAPLWFALLLAESDSRERSRTIDLAVGALQQVTDGPSRTPQLRKAIDLLRAERGQHQISEPRSKTEARKIVIDLIREARIRHGDEGFGAWWRLRTLAIAVRENPAIVLDGATSDLWQEAESCLQTRILPGLTAASYLAEHHGSRERRGVRAQSRELAKAFYQARDAASVMRDDISVVPQFADAWDTVRAHSFDASADWLYGRNGQALLGRQPRGGFSTLDFWLPEVTMEPVALFAHALLAEAGPARETSLTIGGTDGEVVTYSGTLQAVIVELYRRWEVGTTIAFAWNISKDLRRAYKILAENIHTHSDERAPVRCRVEYQSDRAVFTVSDVRRQRSVPRHGNRRGTGQLERLLGACDGNFSVLPTADTEYCTTHWIPVSLERLPGLV
jgi:hypothetical protein